MSHKLLLCTDMDRTIIPNGSEPESPTARPLFRQLVQHPAVTLAYVTGRDIDLVSQAIEAYTLPVPDFIIGDVGTSVYYRAVDRWEADSNWTGLIAKDWGEQSNESLRQGLAGYSLLQAQESTKQKPYKLSYYLDQHTDVQRVLPQLSEDLAAMGIKARLIWSIDEPAAVGLLDIIPASATKRHAIEFLMDKLGFDLATTIFAGDSGNDLPVLLSNINSILVANATEEVKVAVTAFFDTSSDAIDTSAGNKGEGEQELLKSQQGQHPTLYIARGGFKAMNGNYCAGVLEGICHYYPEVEQWLA